jgi:tRNA G18 (ribose-2'-O)-methylase SpoU
VLGLFGIANHDNMGGLFRNAAAFGVSAVLLDAQCCDPLYRKAIRVSVGGVLITPFARLAPGEDPIALLQGFGFSPIALTPRGETPLSRLRRAQGVSIAMSEGFDSLNVATTSGIALHHLARNEDQAR